MKKNFKTTQFMTATLFLIILSQGSAFAAVHDNALAFSGLSGIQIVGAVLIVVLAIVLPLIKDSKKVVYNK